MNVIFDIECDGLEPTKIYCLCYRDIVTNEEGSLTTYEEMRKFLKGVKTLIGHNIIRFDVPVLERLLGINLSQINKVDTLILSWYLYPSRMKHGLESYGDEYGIKKPYILDWDSLDLKDYVHRCEQDVKINYELWLVAYKYLLELYGNSKKLWVFFKYLEKKIYTVHLQEKSRWKLDIDMVNKTLKELKDEQTHKVEILKSVLPKVPITVKKDKPKRMLNNKGEFTKFAHDWYNELDRQGLPPDTETITITKGEEDGNPNSPDQIKSWLFSLGWKPETFKYVRDGEEQRAIPQINLEHGKGICPSVLKLKSVNEHVELIEGLGVIQHRIGILNGFLRENKLGYVYAGIDGLTNTLRSKHRIVVNLPKVDKLYAKGIRSSLIAREGNILCGSDMSSLEDRLKQSYIYKYDPDYVNSMLQEDFDPHLIIAVMAGMMTQEQADAYKKGDKTNKPIRDIAKNGNYACQYGAGPPRLVLTCGISLEQAKKLHAAYWHLNRSIKQVAESQKIKTVNDQLWLYNPVSGFWYSLRYMKDVFSTLIQGTASYVFDMWVFNILSERLQITATFHDEIVLELKKGKEQLVTDIINRSIAKVNQDLKLNRELGVDIQFGENYGEIH